LKYRLIALDVDGTLLNDNYEITEETKQTIADIASAGGKIVLCTGRGPMNALPVLAELGLEGTMITHNGAATVQSANRRVLHQYSFSITDLIPFIDYCRIHHIHMDVSTPFEMFIERVTEAERQMYEKYKAQPVLVKDVIHVTEPPVKFTVFGSQETMDQVESDWRKFSGSLNIIRSGDYFIDVMHADASKGAALKQLADLWNIDASEIIAIGNYYNDVEMIEFAGLGIAMDNSPQEVKDKADDTTASNNENGVHLALRRHFFNDR
jgi:Cof subfamily protein (haloacid dehalogenase superfamily)